MALQLNDSQKLQAMAGKWPLEFVNMGAADVGVVVVPALGRADTGQMWVYILVRDENGFAVMECLFIRPDDLKRLRNQIGFEFRVKEWTTEGDAVWGVSDDGQQPA